MKPRSGFNPEHVAQLAKNVPFRKNPVERQCPACGAIAVRTYVYRSDRPNQPTVISYTWCASCRRSIGSTGPLEPGLAFTDPLSWMSSEERIDLERSGKLLDRLDELWTRGDLPQRFSEGRVDAT